MRSIDSLNSSTAGASSWKFDTVLFAVRVGTREANVEARLVEQLLLDADNDRQIENRIVGGDSDERLFLGFFVNPVLYEMVAKPGDVLQV